MKPPSTVRIRIVDAGRKVISLWLPFFVVWPFGAVLLIIVKVTGNRTGLPDAASVLIRFLCALKGLAIRVDSQNRNSSVMVVFH